MRATSIALAVLATLILHAPGALAQPSVDDERARLHFEAGRSYHEEGNYEAALAEFRRAYELSGRPALLVNMANCQERLGQWAEAASALEGFVASLPEGDAQRPTMERRIANLRQRAERAAATEPTPVERSAEPAERESQDAAAQPASGASDGLLVPSLVAFGVGAAGLIAWGTLGGLALAEESSVASGCGATRSCTPAQVQAMDDLAIGADVSMAIGLAAVAAGAVLILVDPPRSASSEASLELLPTAGRDGVGLTLHGSF